jgi:hypothetical protein
MIKFSDLKQNFQSTEVLSINELTQIFGGKNRDDKRRQRPGGGTTTTSPNLANGGSRYNGKHFSGKCEAALQSYEM